MGTGASVFIITMMYKSTFVFLSPSWLHTLWFMISKDFGCISSANKKRIIKSILLFTHGGLMTNASVQSAHYISLDCIRGIHQDNFHEIWCLGSNWLHKKKIRKLYVYFYYNP